MNNVKTYRHHKPATSSRGLSTPSSHVIARHREDYPPRHCEGNSPKQTPRSKLHEANSTKRTHATKHPATPVCFASRLKKAYALFLFLCTLFACDVNDPRDICCEDLRIDFRYSKGSQDIFPQHIKAMRHYLFNSRGILYKIIEGNPSNPQQLVMKDVLVGKYSLVSIGNIGKATQISNPQIGTTTLSELLLVLENPRPDGFMANSDLLYWGILDFEAIETKHLRYLCDMSNIHCRLTATIRWKDKAPEGNAPYTLELKNIPGQYSLDKQKAYPIYVAGDKQSIKSTKNRVVHSFPKVEETKNLRTHRVEAPRLAGRVKATLVSLRYTKNRIPIFRLYRSGTPIIKALDLGKAFKVWKWETDKNIEQDYHIDIEILGDGSVIIKPSGSANVKDWIDGGSI